MESGEDRLIARFFRPLATHPGALSLTDDAAFLCPPAGHDLVLKTDAIIGGVHFFPDDPPDAVARKALRVNFSDLASKGARPLGFLLTLAMPVDTGEDWLEKFASGLRQDAEQFHCPLFGGDTDRTPGPTTIAIFMLGSVPQGTMVKRAGAKAGDRIAVTGTIGDAALGLKLRREPGLAAKWNLGDAQRDYLLDRYLLPRPRLEIADVLRDHASAAMDVSDGLAGDLAKLCRVSGVGAEIEFGKVPLSPAARAAHASDAGLAEAILAGGDDYEILCAVPQERFSVFRREAETAGIAVRDIGAVVAGREQPRFLDGKGSAITLSRTSFSHF